MSSAETNKAFSPTVSGSRRRAIGLSRHLNRRNSFKSPVLNAETCVKTTSSNNIKHNNEVNATQLSTPDSSLPNVNDIAKSKPTPSSSLTCRPKVKSNTSVIDSTNPSEVLPPVCMKDSSNNITPASSELELNLRLQESHENPTSSSQYPHINTGTRPNVRPVKGSSTKSAAKQCIINVGSQQTSTPSSSRKRPQTQRNIFGKKFKTDFKSPVRNVTVEESKLQIEESISDLKKRLQVVDDEIKNLQHSGYKLEEVQTFMTKLHEYNELKDIGQFLIGQIAFKEGTTTRQVYGRFGLNLED